MFRQSMGENSAMDANASNATPVGSTPVDRPDGLFGDPALREKSLNVALPLAAMIAVVIVWAAAVQVFAVPDYLLPAPLDVVRRIARDWPLLARHAVFTLQAVLVGFGAGVLVGVPLAFAVVMSRSVERVMMPFLVMSQTIPKVAIAPILVVWLGFGILPKIAVVFLITFFPIVVSTVVGLKSVESDMIDLVRSMGARSWKIMLRVRGPSALPQMFAGFKIAICLSVVGAIVGEFVGSDKGLGYLLLTSTGTLDGTLVWSALFILIAMGIILFAIVSKLERLAIPWHVSIRAEETALYQS
jgi:NitT/TauT family transport system permease protein